MSHRRASFALPAGLVIAANHSVASMPGSFVHRFQGLSGCRHFRGKATWRPGENARSCTNPVRAMPVLFVFCSGCRQKLSSMEDAPRDEVLLARLHRNPLPVDDEGVTALHDGHILIEGVSMRLGCR